MACVPERPEPAARRPCCPAQRALPPRCAASGGRPGARLGARRAAPHPPEWRWLPPRARARCAPGLLPSTCS
eukprot:11213074-Lingulodinium_polyedra.AAC.1